MCYSQKSRFEVYQCTRTSVCDAKANFTQIEHGCTLCKRATCSTQLFETACTVAGPLIVASPSGPGMRQLEDHANLKISKNRYCYSKNRKIRQ